MPAGENIAADVEAVKRAADQGNRRRDIRAAQTDLLSPRQRADGNCVGSYRPGDKVPGYNLVTCRNCGVRTVTGIDGSVGLHMPITDDDDELQNWGTDLVNSLSDDARATAKAAGLNPDEVEREINRHNGSPDHPLLTLINPSEADPRELAAALASVIDAMDVDIDDHLADTPMRAAKMWYELLSGYREDPAVHLEKTFEAPTDPGLVIQAGITVQSVCAHHMLPFIGRATVAYRPSPGQRIVGLSKLSRVVQGYAARFQVQERICAQVVDALVDKLNPSGAMCLITAAHDCMRLRGVRDATSTTTTQARARLLLPEEISLIQQQHAASC